MQTDRTPARATILEPGQRLGYLNVQTNYGTILRACNDKGTLNKHGQPVYVVEMDDKKRVEVAHDALGKHPWTIIHNSKVSPESLQKLQRQYQFDWLKEKTEAAKKRLEESGHASQEPIVAFYSPGAEAYGERKKYAVDSYDKNRMQESVKTIKQALQAQYEGVEFLVRHQRDKIFVSWSDGPVFVSRLTEKFIHSPLNPTSQVRVVAPKREISDSLIQSAIAFIQCVLRVDHTPQANSLVNASLYRTGVLRTVCIPSVSINYNLDLCYQDLVRLILLRWDDYDQRFIGEGITRYMREENDTLFKPFEGNMNTVNQIMQEIRLMAKERHSQIDHELGIDSVDNRPNLLRA